MALVNKAFSVSVTPGMMPPIVHVSEYDVGRAYTVSILDEQGNTFTIPSGTTASIEGTLNGSVGFTQSASISNNQVTFTLSQNMTAYAGKAWCKIKLTLNSEPIQTCAFVLAVDRAGVEADTVIGAPGFQEQINQGVAEYLDAHPASGEGWTDAMKTALLDCFANVAWANNQGQTFYDALYAALYNSTPSPTPSPVPSEYQRVEWVGTQNSSIAYILTGISESGMAALAGYSIHLTAAFGVSQPIAGEDTNGSVIAFSSKAGTYFGSFGEGRVAIGANETYALPSNILCTDKNVYNADFSSTGLTLSCGEDSIYRAYSTSGDTAQELVIGTGWISNLNVATWTKYYEVKVTKDGVQVARFYPVYRISDGVIGFYDAVRNQFYTNSGSGSFAKGGDVS